MRHDAVGEILALVFAVAFVIVGLWFAVADRPQPGSLQPCDYGMTQNCE